MALEVYLGGSDAYKFDNDDQSPAGSEAECVGPDGVRSCRAGNDGYTALLLFDIRDPLSFQ